MDKKDRSPDKKREDRLVVNGITLALYIMIFIVAAYSLVMAMGAFIERAYDLEEGLEAAEALDFPANETARNSVIGEFNIHLTASGVALITMFGLIFLCAIFGVPAAWRFYDAYKRRPTLEDRVELLEKILHLPVYTDTMKTMQEAIKKLEKLRGEE